MLGCASPELEPTRACVALGMAWAGGVRGAAWAAVCVLATPAGRRAREHWGEGRNGDGRSYKLLVQGSAGLGVVMGSGEMHTVLVGGVLTQGTCACGALSAG